MRFIHLRQFYVIGLWCLASQYFYTIHVACFYRILSRYLLSCRSFIVSFFIILLSTISLFMFFLVLYFLHFLRIYPVWMTSAFWVSWHPSIILLVYYFLTFYVSYYLVLSVSIFVFSFSRFFIFLSFSSSFFLRINLLCFIDRSFLSILCSNMYLSVLVSFYYWFFNLCYRSWRYFRSSLISLCFLTFYFLVFSFSSIFCYRILSFLLYLIISFIYYRWYLYSFLYYILVFNFSFPFYLVYLSCSSLILLISYPRLLFCV